MLKARISKILFAFIFLVPITGTIAPLYSQDCARICTYFETTDFPDLQPVIAEINTYLRNNPSTITPDCNRRLNYLLAVIYESHSQKDAASHYYDLQYAYGNLCSSDTAKIEAHLYLAGFKTRTLKNQEATSIIDSALLPSRMVSEACCNC